MASLQSSGLSSSTINLRLSAVKKLAAEALDNGLLDPTLAHGIGRVKGIKRAGVRVANWLTKEQAQAILNAPKAATLKGNRDLALLAVLIGCGLRRTEVSNMLFSHIQQRESRRLLVDLVGKGGRIRSVPMPSWCKNAIDAWTAAAGHYRGFDLSRHEQPPRADRPLLAQNIMDAVIRYGAEIGSDRLAPHDLRRTFAKLAHGGHSPLEQIQLSLGHASIQTTERYLGVSQDLIDALCDHLGLRLNI
jgi:integrase